MERRGKPADGIFSWFAAGEDHEVSAPAPISAYAIALHDPKNEWNVTIKLETSSPTAHPQAVAILPDGFVLTGGGAFVNWHGAGNLLTASFPNSDNSWEARSKDHDVSDPAQITAYAIGIRPKPKKRVGDVIKSATGAVAAHPSAHIALDPGWTMSGGGALDNWNGGRQSGDRVVSKWGVVVCFRQGSHRIVPGGDNRLRDWSQRDLTAVLADD